MAVPERVAHDGAATKGDMDAIVRTKVNLHTARTFEPATILHSLAFIQFLRQ